MIEAGSSPAVLGNDTAASPDRFDGQGRRLASPL